jgi:Spy/CpxP family protein refolding chaperone
MRTVKPVLTLLVAMLATVPLAAQERRAALVERIQELNLTDEQEAKIAEIQKAGRPKVEAAGKALAAVAKEEVDKAMAILTPHQKEKLTASKEDRKELRAEGVSERLARLEELDLSDAQIAQLEAVRKECRPELAKAIEGLRGLLTPEQRKAREEALASGKKHREVLAALNLTPEQKEKVGAACKECCTAIKGELEKIKDALTAQEKEKLADLRDERKENVRDRRVHRIANLRELELTPEQQAKLTAIRTEYRPKVHDAGNALRAAVRDELQSIVGVLRQ